MRTELNNRKGIMDRIWQTTVGKNIGPVRRNFVRITTSDFSQIRVVISTLNQQVFQSFDFSEIRKNGKIYPLSSASGTFLFY